MAVRAVSRIAILAMVLVPIAPALAAPACTIALKDAHVWDSAAFVTRTLAMANGRFVATPVGTTVVDGSALYLLPPFVDAHTHTIDTPDKPRDAKHVAALAAGVFYALNPNDIRPVGPTPRPSSTEVDLQAAGGGLTRPGGHPHPLYSFLASRNWLGVKEADLNGRAFREVATVPAAQAAVRAVKANGASVIKLYLLDHDRPSSAGLSAATFRAAVIEARTLGLLPVVHVETAAEFALAVAARVHAIMHSPYRLSKNDPTGHDLLITRATARDAARAGIIVVPTLTAGFTGNDGAKLALIQSVQRANLTTLRDAGVRITVGADNYKLGMHDELTLLRATALFEAPQLIAMATANGAALAFPTPRLGTLTPGAEASFVGYFVDPTTDWAGLREPVVGMREGQVLVDPVKLLAACGPAAQ